MELKNINFLYKKYLFKSNFFFSKKNFLETSKYVILIDGFRDKFIFIIFLNKVIFHLNYLSNLNEKLLYLNLFKGYNLNVGVSEYDLKGVNYGFSLLKDLLFLDLGRSHFQIINYFSNNFFFKLKKKGIKKLLFVSFNKNRHNSISNFFGFKLKKIGPYKLKGFQFVNERFNLKEGKKPFK